MPEREHRALQKFPGTIDYRYAQGGTTVRYGA
jgi:hypothetical protein